MKIGLNNNVNTNLSFGNNIKDTAKDFQSAIETTYHDVFDSDDKKITTKEVVAGTATGAAATKLVSLAKGSKNVASLGKKVVGEATEQVVKHQGSLQNVLSKGASRLKQVKGLGFLGKALESKLLLNVMKPVIGLGSVMIVAGQLATVYNVASGVNHNADKA